MILLEVFLREAGKVYGNYPKTIQYVREAFGIMRVIVSAGRSIYPSGYFFGHRAGAVGVSILYSVY